ncbi:MAG: hypothetical protein IIX01_04260 [Clostridia bacterium]|nr:hypothetical protein [Clostridia bacterium]
MERTQEPHHTPYVASKRAYPEFDFALMIPTKNEGATTPACLMNEYARKNPGIAEFVRGHMGECSLNVFGLGCYEYNGWSWGDYDLKTNKRAVRVFMKLKKSNGGKN